jgi:hypothetical protein
MWMFFLRGGVPMFGVVAFGLAAGVGALRFAMQPDPRRVGAIVSMSLALLGATLLGVFADLATVGISVGGITEPLTGVELGRIVLTGIGECMSPLILGFSLLTGIALLMSVGFRRLVPRLPAA